MLTKDIQEKFPFVSVVQYGGAEYVGIVCNQDQYITTMIVYEKLNTPQEKQLMLDLGEIWWWESNRMIPINIFLKQEIDAIRHAIMVMNSKDVRIAIGPTVNLNNLAVKRVKRKSVQLVKKN